MLRKPNLIGSLFFVSLLSACGGTDRDTSESPPLENTRIIFSPGTGELPIPSDLIFEQGEGADGTFSVSDCEDDDTQCLAEEAANPVIAGIEILDGASTIAPIDILVDGSLDTSQTLDAANFIASNGAVIPNPNQNVFLLPLIYPGGDSVLQVPGELPTFSEAISFQSAAALADLATLTELAIPTARAEIISLDGGVDNVIRISPLQPLLPKTKYLVVITEVLDTNGNALLPSLAYSVLRDPAQDITSLGGVGDQLEPVRNAILGWERLASGYFGFKQSVYQSAQLNLPAPTLDDVIITYTFTTGGTQDVLKSIAAPERFFEQSISTGIRQDAITKVINGTYNLSGGLDASLSEVDNTAITLLNMLLTTPLVDEAPNPLFNETIATSIAAGATYASFAQDTTALFIIQNAAAEAAIIANNNDGISINQEAIGTVSAIAAGAGAQVADIFPVAQARESTFFRVDQASQISELLAAPATLYQGEITLPQYLANPSQNPALIITGRWQANSTIGNLIDAGSGNSPGTTPPSDQITYRYPFPQLDSNTRVPILVTSPDETTLANFGITRPENGWPVILYIHGVRSDRSASLALANALAFACVDQTTFTPSGLPCFATVAIDQPIHGVAAQGSTFPGLTSYNDPNNPIVPNLPAASPNAPSPDVTERHFDLTADAQNLPIPMDYSAGVGVSGAFFINLTNFGRGRDNLRQLVIDMLNVNASIDTMDLNADGTADELDINNVFVMAQSLGGINGIPFVTINNDAVVQSSLFNNLPPIKGLAAFNTGGGIPRLLSNSNSFAATVLGGLAAASEGVIAQGNSALETYLSIYQGALDSVDPLNFANELADPNSDIGVFLTEIIGDGTEDNLPDQTIPNAADDFWGPQFGPLQLTIAQTGFVIDGFPAPLAGTEPLIAEFNAVPTGTETNDGDPPVTVTRYMEGTHITPISADNQTVFFDIINNVVGLFASAISE